ncbi:MAG: 30S ribosomal protein S8 [Candidatus Saccharimonadales bacterium]
MVDPIADMLTRIRNALAVNKTEVSLPHSKTKQAVADVLSQYGFLAGVKADKEAKRTLQLQLVEGGKGVGITEIHRISKPGRRVFVTAGEIPTVLRGRGIVVISTSSGIMSGGEARKKGIGGELICKVW